MPYYHYECSEKFPENERVYHMLIRLMLLSKTKEYLVDRVMQSLIEEHNLRISTILKTSEEELSQWLHLIAFNRAKAKLIKKATW